MTFRECIVWKYTTKDDAVNFHAMMVERNGAGLCLVRPGQGGRTISVAVFSKIPDLLRHLKAAVPYANFQEVIPGKESSVLANAEVIVGDFNLLAPYLYKLPNTKWVQGTWAGVDKLMPLINKEKPPSYVVSRFSGEHFGRMMGEYVMFNIVNIERNMNEVQANQNSKTWSQYGRIGRYRVIADLNIGILGVGTIGDWIGRMLHRFGAKIYGFGRKPTLDLNEVNYFTYYYTKPKLKDFLKQCDYIINILPDTSETRGLLNDGVLEICRDRMPILINIGRGSIISESDLIEAFRSAWLSAAVLDVFGEEPLPRDSPLWSMPQVKITPHVAGCSRAKDIARQFGENLQHYKRGGPIPLTIDFSKEY